MAFFQLLLFAFNGMHWFKRLCLPPQYWGTTLETLRTDFLVLPAKLARHGGRNVLQLPKDYHHREDFLRVWKRVNALKVRTKC